MKYLPKFHATIIFKIMLQSASKANSILSTLNLEQQSNTAAGAPPYALLDTASGPLNASNTHETNSENNLVAQAAVLSVYDFTPYVGDTVQENVCSYGLSTKRYKYVIIHDSYASRSWVLRLAASRK